MGKKITLTINPTTAAKCCENIYSSVYTCPKIVSESWTKSFSWDVDNFPISDLFLSRKENSSGFNPRTQEAESGAFLRV